MARSTPEWIGRTDDSQPTIHVLLRLYSRQNGICACGCGVTMNLDRDELDQDHIVPLRDGGENRESNLQLIFRAHHREKTRAENIQRGKERQHKAKAFTAKRKPKWQGGGFPKAEPQRSASKPLTKRVNSFQEQ